MRIVSEYRQSHEPAGDNKSLHPHGFGKAEMKKDLLKNSKSFFKCGFYTECRTIQEDYRVFADICVAFPELEVLP